MRKKMAYANSTPVAIQSVLSLFCRQGRCFLCQRHSEDVRACRNSILSMHSCLALGALDMADYRFLRRGQAKS
jgi:hypothetical protein